MATSSAQQPKPSASTEAHAPQRPPGRQAAERADERVRLHLRLPLLGEVDLPPADALAFAGGLGVLALAGAIDWPVAGLIALGHYLSQNRQSAALRIFGEALEEG
ncbi:MAG: hypothetical protein ACYCO3_03920 [Mycobacteriales bacterium]